MLQEPWKTQIPDRACSQLLSGVKMAALLLQELGDSEICKIPKPVQNKLERILSDQQYEIDSLKAQQEQFRVDNGEWVLVIPLASAGQC